MHENTQKLQTTHDDFILHPNHLYMTFGHFVVVSHQYSLKMFRTKEQDPKYENLPKIETNPT